MKPNQSNYRDLITFDLDFHQKAPYQANKNTPINRWCLIPESCSQAWVKTVLNELDKPFDYLFDPFFGAGVTALEAVARKLPFIGGEIRAELVIGTISKVLSYTIASNELQVVLQDLQRQVTNMSKGGDNLVDLSHRINTHLIESQIEIETKFLLFNVLFSSLRNLPNSVASFLSTFKNLSNQVLNDINRIAIQEPVLDKWLINCGDSNYINWSNLIPKVIDKDPAHGIYLTSPTFVNSARIYGDLEAHIGRLAMKALTTSHFPKLSFSEPHSTFIHERLVEEVAANFPKSIYQFLKAITQTLIQFKLVAAPGSTIVIENENGSIGSEVVETDMMLCYLGDLIGLQIDSVRVTHFVVKPGTISYSPTDKRGSIIYMSV